MKRLVFLLSVFGPSLVSAGGTFGVGVSYERWEANFTRPFNGWEIWIPLHFQLDAGEHFSFYTETRYGTGNYESALGTEPKTDRLTAFSDTLFGVETAFSLFGAPSLFNIELNLPTGKENWEEKQLPASLPVEFVPSRYRGRGFGASFLYAAALGAENRQIGLAMGYLFSGTFQPDASVSSEITTGDALYAGLNGIRVLDGGREIRWSAAFYYGLPAEENDVKTFQLGPNINVSYGWFRPEGFSWDLQAEFYAKAKRLAAGELATEPHHSLGPRVTFLPVWSKGNISLAGILKWVAPNGYEEQNADFDGGGFRVGLAPSYRLWNGRSGAVWLDTGYDVVWDRKAGLDEAGNRSDVRYNRWTFGSRYEVRW